MSETATPPTAEPPLLRSGLCRQAQLESEQWQEWARQLRQPDGVMNRKTWEFCYIAQALSERGLLKAGMRGLGFAVGQEPLAAFFAGRGCEIVATDLHDDLVDDGWKAFGRHAASIADLNRDGIVDDATMQRLVHFRSVDMNRIPADLTGFDFTWSACSFEHIGSLEAGLRFVWNAMRCLKPGGIAVHTTEHNLSSDEATIDEPGLALYRKRDLVRLIEALRAAGHEVEMDWTEGDGPADLHVGLPPYAEPCMRLQIQEYVATSVGLIIRKGTADEEPGRWIDGPAGPLLVRARKRLRRLPADVRWHWARVQRARAGGPPPTRFPARVLAAILRVLDGLRRRLGLVAGRIRR